MAVSPRKESKGNRSSKQRPRPKDDKRPSFKRVSPGLLARDAAVSALYSVFVEHRSFDESFEQAISTRDLEGRDRAFSRLIATTVLRNRGSLDAVVGRFLQKPLPKSAERLGLILLAGAAQLILLDTPAHAAISIAVDQSRLDRNTRHYDKLTNAVLRSIDREGREILAGVKQADLNIPEWLMARWQNTYGAETARAIAAASLMPPALDLSVQSDASGWAERTGGVVLPTGSVRLPSEGRVEEIAGYNEGAWWVQDAAAALPVKLFGSLKGRRAIDLCAAPGGKTMQLAVAGALVTALDKSGRRLNRVQENLERVKLTAELIAKDADAYQSDKKFDAVLLDAPCTATGTIRRHPDILYLKKPDDVAALHSIQSKLLNSAAELVAPGGTLVFCTCSLEPEEGIDHIAPFLEAHADFRRKPIQAEVLVVEGGSDAVSEMITADGDLRTLPFHLSQQGNTVSGCDGFFACRLVRL